jgi:hypothetical protein
MNVRGTVLKLVVVSRNYIIDESVLCLQTSNLKIREGRTLSLIPKYLVRIDLATTCHMFLKWAHNQMDLKL